MANPSRKIRIWGSKVDNGSKIGIWETIPENFMTTVNNEAPSHSRVTKHWGSRYALYGFILSIILQLVTVSIFLGIKTSELSASGVSLDKIEAEALASVQELGLPLLIAQLSMYLGWILAMFYVTFRKGLHSFAKDFWLRFNWKVDITFGIVIALSLRIFEAFVFFILQTLGVSLAGADNSSQWQGTTVWAYVFMFGIVSVIGPFCEELFFRGLLLQGLIKTFRRRSLVPRTWVGEKIQRVYPPFWYAFSNYKEFLYRHKYTLAVILSSLAFGFMHFQGFETFGQWLVVIETGLVGVVFAIMTLKTRRLGMAISAHIMFNFSGMFISLFA